VCVCMCVCVLCVCCDGPDRGGRGGVWGVFGTRARGTGIGGCAPARLFTSNTKAKTAAAQRHTAAQPRAAAPAHSRPSSPGPRTCHKLQVDKHERVGPVLVERVEHHLLVAQVGPAAVEQQQAGQVLELRVRLGGGGWQWVAVQGNTAGAGPRCCAGVVGDDTLTHTTQIGPLLHSPHTPIKHPHPHPTPKPRTHLRKRKVAGQHRRPPLPPADPHPYVRRPDHPDVVGAIPYAQRDGACQLLDQVGDLGGWVGGGYLRWGLECGAGGWAKEAGRIVCGGMWGLMTAITITQQRHLSQPLNS